MTNPTVPGVDRDGLAAAIHYNTRPITLLSANLAADVALAYVAAHHECAYDREADLMRKVREAVAGELQQAASLAVDPSDSKCIWDYRTQRLAEYDAAIEEMKSNA